jgi:hypothetical protein
MPRTLTSAPLAKNPVKHAPHNGHSCHERTAVGMHGRCWRKEVKESTEVVVFLVAKASR